MGNFLDNFNLESQLVNIVETGKSCLDELTDQEKTDLVIAYLYEDKDFDIELTFHRIQLINILTCEYDINKIKLFLVANLLTYYEDELNDIIKDTYEQYQLELDSLDSKENIELIKAEDELLLRQGQEFPAEIINDK